MNRLVLKLFFPLERYELGRWPPHGPLFHRWLPDGEMDAITVDRPSEHCRIMFWFERWGYMNDRGTITHSYERREIEPEEVPEQRMLDAGGIIGRVILDDVSDEAMTAVRDGTQDDPAYEALAKRVVKRILEPSVQRLITIMRVNYGQYWLRECEPWDSRRDSIGARCNQFQLKWTPDDGVTWLAFRPNKAVTNISLIWDTSDIRYEPLLNETDWGNIRVLMTKEYLPLPEGEILSRAHESLDQGRERFALLEAITAIELAVERRLKAHLSGEKGFLDAVQGFWDLSLKARVVMIARLTGAASPEDVKLAVEAIEWRNKAAHEGARLPDDVRSKIMALLRISCVLLSIAPAKVPEMEPNISLRGRPKTASNFASDQPA